MLAKASAPKIGKIKVRPKLTFRPDSARIMKQLAVSQWVKRSKLANRRIVLPEFRKKAWHRSMTFPFLFT
jgi:hypothetical protein